MNDRVYIHEFIDIIGHNRANYMHHMTANWSPIAQAARHQLCYGVWGVVGTTGAGRRSSTSGRKRASTGSPRRLGHETDHPTLQDQKLAKWWSEACQLPAPRRRPRARPRALDPDHRGAVRGGGEGRGLRPRDGDGRAGQADDFLLIVADQACRRTPPSAGAGRRVAHRNDDDSECILIWAIPTCRRAESSRPRHSDPGLVRWQTQLRDRTTSFERILMNDAAPLPHEARPPTLPRRPRRELDRPVTPTPSGRFATRQARCGAGAKRRRSPASERPLPRTRHPGHMPAQDAAPKRSGGARQRANGRRHELEGCHRPTK